MTNNIDKKNKKRIMLVVPMLDQGGLERVCALTGQLLKEKYDIYIAVFNTTGMIYDVSGINLIDLKLGAVPGKIGKLVNIFKRAHVLSRICKEKNIDVVYSFGMTANIACSFIVGSVKKIGACHSHGEIGNTRYLKLLKNRMDIIICCSKKMAKEVKDKINTDKVIAVWNPCDIDEIKRLSNCEIPEYKEFFDKYKKIVVAMGREDDVKGYWHLIKAFRRIYESNPDCGLAIIGTGQFTEYKEMTDKLEISENVVFTGLQKNPFCYLKSSSVLALSSLSEGLPNTLVEAMAVGLPIVSVNCESGPAEILNEDFLKVDTDKGNYYANYGILTPAFTMDKDMCCKLIDNKIILTSQEEDLAMGLLEMLYDESMSNQYALAGEIQSNAFSKERYRENIINCIERLGEF